VFVKGVEGGGGVCYRFLKGREIEKAMRERTRGLETGIVLLQKYQCGQKKRNSNATESEEAMPSGERVDFSRYSHRLDI